MLSPGLTERGRLEVGPSLSRTLLYTLIFADFNLYPFVVVNWNHEYEFCSSL